MTQFNAVIDAGRGSTLPSSPYDGLVYHYASTAAGGTVVWHLRYDSASTYWEVTGGPPLVATIDTNQSLTSSSYGTIATAGPSITVPLAGDYFVQVGARISQLITAGFGLMSYTIGGTAAADGDAAQFRSDVAAPNGSEAATVASPVRLKALAAAALVSNYKANGSTATFFQNRWMQVLPIRVK